MIFFLQILGKDKLGVPASEPVWVVLECDGTQVEDGEYFRTLANNTVLVLLRQGERWYPTGVDVIKAGMYKLYTWNPFNEKHSIDNHIFFVLTLCLFFPFLSLFKMPHSDISYTKNRLRDDPCIRTS